MIMKLSYLIENLIFPPKCANCGELLDIDITKKVLSPLCDGCRFHYENEKMRECGRCGLSMVLCRCMPPAMEKAQCTSLLKLTSYRSNENSMPIRSFIYSVKLINNSISFDFLTEQLKGILISEMRALSLNPEDCVITYLPRSYKNKAEYGFDQGLKLAKRLSFITGIEFAKCFVRRFNVGEQKGLNKYERKLNMKSAYISLDMGDNLKNKTVILVDDIVTTGSSMASASRLIFSQGAYQVIGICLGYTEKTKNR